MIKELPVQKTLFDNYSNRPQIEEVQTVTPITPMLMHQELVMPIANAGTGRVIENVIIENETQLLNTNIPDIPAQVAMIKKNFAVLKGLYVIIRMPTEERLTTRFEDLSKDNFEQLTELVERYMRDIDLKYRHKENRGRSWKGTGHRLVQIPTPPQVTQAQLQAIDTRVAGMMDSDVPHIPHPTLVEIEATTGHGTSERTLRFSPFPSSTVNIFKTLRKMRADIYHRHCIVLERQEESFQNNINILPYANAPEFAMDLKEINIKIHEANNAIREYQTTEDWNNLLQELAPYQEMADYLRHKTWTVEDCTLITTEIVLETAQVKQHIEEEYRKMFVTIDDEKAKAIEAVHEEFEKGQRSIAEAALESLKGELEIMVKRVVSASKRHPERVKADLERLRRKIVSIGLDALEPTVIQLETVFDDPEKAMDIFGTRDIETAISARVQGLIDSL